MQGPRELGGHRDLLAVTPNSDKSGTLEVQPEHGTGERRSLPIVFQTFANKCLTLSTSEALGLSTAVGVEYNDVLFVGEVMSCTAGVGDQWQVEIKVAQTLSGLQSLLMLRAELDRHQGESKDAAMEEPISCAVLKTEKKKAVKTFPKY
jgi:hypothetical protein